jgi:hypothetical protein
LSDVLSSWSRRRAAVAQEAVDELEAAEAAVVAEKQAELAEKSDDEILEELGLPDPDTLVQGDDFKAFMSKAVPQHLRKRALRKLWRSNPVLACVDGLNDYDDDYLTGSTGQGAIKTTYQVGKGMLAHLLEMERQKEAKAAPAVVMAEAAAAEEEDEGAVAQIDAIVPEVQASPDDASADADPTEEAARPRRMQFQFEGDAA